MEQPDELRWLAHERAEVASLDVVTAGAGSREIVRLRWSAVFAADDVVLLATPKRVILMDETILADVIGALGDLPAQPFAHVTSHEREAGGRGLLRAA